MIFSYGHNKLDETGSVIEENNLTDGHGSVRVLTNLMGAFSQFYTYDAYGQLLAIFNNSGRLAKGGISTLGDATAARTRLLYSGESFEPQIGQQYLRGRWYRLSTGPFDPLGTTTAGTPARPIATGTLLASGTTTVSASCVLRPQRSISAAHCFRSRREGQSHSFYGPNGGAMV